MSAFQRAVDRVLQALLVLLSLSLLSAVRAYVNGESLWSKGQKDASYALSRYVDSRDDSDFRRYLDAVAVPLGHHRARLALEAPRLERGRTEVALAQGGNHPEDFDGMIALYRYFGGISPLRQAIELWAAADESLLQLDRLAHEIAAAFHADPSSSSHAGGQEPVVVHVVRMFPYSFLIAPITTRPSKHFFNSRCEE